MSISLSCASRDDFAETQQPAVGGEHMIGDEDDEEILADIDAAGEAARQQTHIWGTEINVQNCINVFRLFLESFSPLTALANAAIPSRGEDGSLSYYHRFLLHLQRIARPEQTITILSLDCRHLQQFAATRLFYDQLVRYPQEVVPLLDQVASEEVIRLHGQGRFDLPDTVLPVQVRPFNLANCVRLRELDPEQIDNLVSLRGMTLRLSSVLPDLKVAVFRCSLCAAVVEVGIDRGRIEEPNLCQQCQQTGTLSLLHNRCVFTDKQLVRLQETPDDTPAGETPYTMTLFAFDDLVDSVRPGDRVEVTGVFRAVAKRVHPKQRNVQTVFRTYIDVLHFRLLHHTQGGEEGNGSSRYEGAGEMGRAPQELGGGIDDMLSPLENNASIHSNSDLPDEAPSFSTDQIARFQAFAGVVGGGDVYQRLLSLFAPSVYGLEDVKKGLLCMLFGGTVRTPLYYHLRGQENTVDSVHLRGDINILLCGDPGTSKSQLLSYVHRLSSRGIYTSGKGSSAVGLTASVARDPETKEVVLESGALVLSDQGICCIDEFDKMSDQTRAILHEAMEQQTVSVTKAGIIATLHARTSILASANPVQSRYNPRLSVLENIQLPPTLISRFDLIYLILDKPDKEADRRLAHHLVSLYHPGSTSSSSEVPANVQGYDQSFLRSYILYARYYIFPEISAEAEPVLQEAYLAMRSLGGGGAGGGGSRRVQHHITATPRQLESLIRLSQALAKMRLSSLVTPDDVHEAVRLMKVATQTAAIDPRTGTIDMDLLTTGRSAIDRDLSQALAQHLFDHFLAPTAVASSAVHALGGGERITLGQLRHLLVQAARRGESGPGGKWGAGVTMGQMEAAVRELDAQGVVHYIESSQTILLNHRS
eukprot:scaffold2507_cov257-Ochromonas_danica.AAC.18